MTEHHDRPCKGYDPAEDGALTPEPVHHFSDGDNPGRTLCGLAWTEEGQGSRRICTGCDEQMAVKRGRRTP